MLKGASVVNIAQQLRNQIDELHRQRKDKVRLVLLAHSLGCLVCMRYILRCLSRGDQPPVLGLIMYGTPISGVELVRIADLLSIAIAVTVPGFGKISWMAKKANRQLAELGLGSYFLRGLHDKWALRVVNGGHPTEDARRRMWLPVRVVTGNEDWIVSESSAKGVYGEVDWHPVSYGHIDLVKPSNQRDERYLTAKGFIEDCRRNRYPDVVTHLRRLSDDFWKLRQQKIIRDWHYKVHIRPSSTWDLAGITVATFSMETCRYTTLLEESAVVIGFSLGQSAGKTIWQEVKPAYVHRLRLETIPVSKRKELKSNVIEILQKKNKRNAWSILFPKMKVAVQPPGGVSQIPLTEKEVKADGEWIMCSYSDRSALAELLGEEVQIIISYESVWPRGMTAFNVFFPWVTHGCSVQIYIHENLETLSATSNSFGKSQLTPVADYLGIPATVYVKSTEVVLPDSYVDIQWQNPARRR